MRISLQCAAERTLSVLSSKTLQSFLYAIRSFESRGNLVATGIRRSEMDGAIVGGGWCDGQRWVVRERDGKGGQIYLAVYPVTVGLCWST
ncbi:hypothetical protein L2E82_10217 [Cichorium intybus]|uniref:Uncharacterized protein n=1 Tax=Cichorium intybus TaxID=13427 RepID=A0ACB9GAJ0_CICIN|nr:hypothetical protein L2E82_10217 [Cichorium intybus]